LPAVRKLVDDHAGGSDDSVPEDETWLAGLDPFDRIALTGKVDEVDSEDDYTPALDGPETGDTRDVDDPETGYRELERPEAHYAPNRRHWNGPKVRRIALGTATVGVVVVAGVMAPKFLSSSPGGSGAVASSSFSLAPPHPDLPDATLNGVLSDGLKRCVIGFANTRPGAVQVTGSTTFDNHDYSLAAQEQKAVRVAFETLGQAQCNNKYGVQAAEDAVKTLPAQEQASSEVTESLKDLHSLGAQIEMQNQQAQEAYTAALASFNPQQALLQNDPSAKAAYDAFQSLAPAIAQLLQSVPSMKNLVNKADCDAQNVLATNLFGGANCPYQKPQDAKAPLSHDGNLAVAALTQASGLIQRINAMAQAAGISLQLPTVQSKPDRQTSSSDHAQALDDMFGGVKSALQALSTQAQQALTIANNDKGSEQTKFKAALAELTQVLQQAVTGG
jgi:hypothetical protein